MKGKFTFERSLGARGNNLDNQHRRELSQAEIDLMNEIKAKGEELDALLRRVSHHVSKQIIGASNSPFKGEMNRLDAAGPQRWIAIARTDFQTGVMALVRAVAQPTTF